MSGDSTYTNEELILTYKGTQISPETYVNLSFKTTAGSGAVKGAKLGADKSVRFTGGGNGAIPDTKEEINAVIEWEGLKEIVTLKGKSD